MIYDGQADSLRVCADLRRGTHALKALGYRGWQRAGVLATWEPVAKTEKSASPFRAAAFLGADGVTYETGAFHDVEALPAGVEVSAEGFVDADGRFFTRDEATQTIDADHPVQSQELDLKKAEPVDLIQHWKALAGKSQDQVVDYLRSIPRDHLEALDTHVQAHNAATSRAATGSPAAVPMYHGTPHYEAIMRDGFKLTQGSRTIGFLGGEKKVQNQGIFLTPQKPMAEFFGRNRAEYPADARVLPVYANLGTVLDLTKLPSDLRKIAADAIQQYAGNRRPTQHDLHWLADHSGFVEATKRRGYGSLRFPEAVAVNKLAGTRRQDTSTYMVFDPAHVQPQRSHVHIGNLGEHARVMLGTAAAAPLGKAEGELRAAAFRHKISGQVYETGAYHSIDPWLLGGAATLAGHETGPHNSSDWESGFTTHGGQFLDREQALAFVDGVGTLGRHPITGKERTQLDSADDVAGLKKAETPAANWVMSGRDRASGYRLMAVDLRDLDRHWSRDPLYLGPQDPGIGNRRHEARKFLASGQPVHAPSVVYKPEFDSVAFIDGRHRAAEAREAGHRRIYVAVPGDNVEAFGKKFGGKHSSGLRKSFSQELNNYLIKSGKQVIDLDNISERLSDHQGTLEAMAAPGGPHPAFQIAARLAGHPADANLRREAELQYGDDLIAVALAAHGLDPEDESLRMSIEAAIQTLRLQKSEFSVAVLPRVVMPGQDGAEHMAMTIRNAYGHNLVYEVRLGGKHSAGAAVAYDRETDRFWLLKPGSARVSPAAGVNETPYSQSRREAAFAQAVRAHEPMRAFYPETWLLLLDGHETACIEVAGPGFRPAQKYGDAAGLLKPYQETLDIYRWAFWDWVLGNADCHGGNVLVTEDGRVALIDHGSSLAGPAFNPAHDGKKSFIPYYLRIFKDIDYSQAAPEQRYRAFPQPKPDERQTLKIWLASLGNRWEQVLAELAPLALPACRARLEALQAADDPADALLRAWAGLPTDGSLTKAEDDWSPEAVKLAPTPKNPWQEEAEPEALLNYWRWALHQDNGNPDLVNGIIENLRQTPVTRSRLNSLLQQTPAHLLFNRLGDGFGAIMPAALVARKIYVYGGHLLDESLAATLGDKFAEALASPHLEEGEYPVRTFSFELGPYLPEAQAVKVMQAADKRPGASEQMFLGYNEGIKNNKNLGQAFADWAASSPNGSLFLGPENPALQHADRQDLLRMLNPEGRAIQNPALLWAPQLTEDDVVGVLNGSGLDGDARAELVSNWNKSHDWTTPERLQTVFSHVVDDARVRERTRLSAAGSERVRLGVDQIEAMLRLGKLHDDEDDTYTGRMLANQLQKQPGSKSILDLAAPHAVAVANHFDDYGSTLEPHEVDQREVVMTQLMTHPEARKALGSRQVHRFWHDYETDVSPHHFAVVQKHLNADGKDVEIEFFRSKKKGRSAVHPGIAEGLDEHAQAVQKEVLKDPRAAIKDIGGKKHILVYRGVSGSYAHKIIEGLATGVQNYELPNAQMSSWSAHPKIASSFAARRISGQPKSGVVIRRWMPVEDILHSGAHTVAPGQRHAHVDECELVFRHREPAMKVRRHDIQVKTIDRKIDDIEVMLAAKAGTAGGHIESHEAYAKANAPTVQSPVGKLGEAGKHYDK